MLEKKHRLPRDRYRGRVTAAFTICVFDKAPLFVRQSSFESMEEMLRQAMKRHNCEAHVYLFMPDHVHLLLEGRTDQADLWRCVVDFKQRSGYWLSKNNLRARWQKDFYDHILRKGEEIARQVKYILGNPVRVGVIDKWVEYPFKGSTIYNFEDWELESAP